MRGNRNLWLAAAACLITVAQSSAYLIQSTQGAGVVVQASWPRQVISFRIDAAGSDDLTADETARILRESFAVWEDVPSAALRFDDQGTSGGRAPSRRDGRNLLIFDETGDWLGAPDGSGIIAVTRLSSDSRSGRISDADIIFNGRDHRFSATPQNGRVLLQDVAVHEIGHLIGLDHTPVAGDPETRPTMNPFYFADGPGLASSLEADDIAGVSVLFPSSRFETTSGSIAGHVTTIDGEAVFGAVVTAVDEVTGDLIATLSGAETGAADRGAFTLRGLATGSYRIAISTLPSGMDESNFGGLFTDFDGGFPSEYFGNVERADLATPVTIDVPGLRVAGVDFTAGFREPGQPLVEAVGLPNNTPDARGPYAPRFQIVDAVHADLTVDTGALRLVLPLQAVEPDLFSAAIPGQPVGTRIRYRVQATSATGQTADFPADGGWLAFDVIGLSGSPLAFAVLREDGVLGVFDTGSESEVARVRLGVDPIQVLTSLDGDLLYVSNLGSDEISVIETATFRVVDHIAVAAQPLDMALSADGATLYVANSGAAALSSIDLATRTVTESTSIGQLGDGPYGVVAGDGRVYVTDLNSATVLAVADGGVIARIPVAAGPRSLAVSADGGELYVTSFATGTFTIIDTHTETVTATVSLPVQGSFAIAVHPGSGYVFVTGHQDGVVVAIDPATRQVVKVVAVGDDPRGLSLSPDGSRLYVTTATSDEIHVLDSADLEPRGSFRANGGPRGISVIASPSPISTPTAVDAGPAPVSWALSDAFPNPFNAEMSLRVAVPQAGAYTVGVYSTLGQRLRQLDGYAGQAGTHQVSWDARDAAGKPVASGLYLFIMDTPAGRLARKAMLLR